MKNERFCTSKDVDGIVADFGLPMKELKICIVFGYNLSVGDIIVFGFVGKC